jgi:hypothetical protein
MTNVGKIPRLPPEGPIKPNNAKTIHARPNQIGIAGAARGHCGTAKYAKEKDKLRLGRSLALPAGNFESNFNF